MWYKKVLIPQHWSNKTSMQMETPSLSNPREKNVFEDPIAHQRQTLHERFGNRWSPSRGHQQQTLRAGQTHATKIRTIGQQGSFENKKPCKEIDACFRDTTLELVQFTRGPNLNLGSTINLSWLMCLKLLRHTLH